VTQAPAPSGGPPAKPDSAPGATGQASSGGPTDAKPDAGAVGRRAVKLVFQRDSWVEARDADNKVLFTGTQKAGTEHEFTASGPVSMIIGNAEFVRAEVDGKPFDLVPHTRAAIARVTLR
jgi:cytoskeleton protein RodZ